MNNIELSANFIRTMSGLMSKRSAVFLEDLEFH